MSSYPTKIVDMKTSKEGAVTYQLLWSDNSKTWEVTERLSNYVELIEEYIHSDLFSKSEEIQRIDFKPSAVLLTPQTVELKKNNTSTTYKPTIPKNDTENFLENADKARIPQNLQLNLSRKGFPSGEHSNSKSPEANLNKNFNTFSINIPECWLCESATYHPLLNCSRRNDHEFLEKKLSFYEKFEMETEEVQNIYKNRLKLIKVLIQTLNKGYQGLTNAINPIYFLTFSESEKNNELEFRNAENSLKEYFGVGKKTIDSPF
ncbi:hypothetical protein HDU92_003837 [Lobulomyces angularis]|nr:hypothetical protein HDU92_003837 [Lobulomyces angularis]